MLSHEEISSTPAGLIDAIVTVSQEVERRFNQGLKRPLATHVYNSFDHSLSRLEAIGEGATAKVGQTKMISNTTRRNEDMGIFLAFAERANAKVVSPTVNA